MLQSHQSYSGVSYSPITLVYDNNSYYQKFRENNTMDNCLKATFMYYVTKIWIKYTNVLIASLLFLSLPIPIKKISFLDGNKKWFTPYINKK